MNQKAIIATAALLIGILLFSAFGIFPLLHKIQRDSQALETQYQEVLEASFAETEAADFAKFFATNQQDFEKIESMFVDTATPIAFIRFVEEIAESSALLVKITPGNAKKQKGVPWLLMDFQLASSGAYPDVLRFLEKLENGPFLLDLKNTSLSRNRGAFLQEQALQRVNFTMVLDVFGRPQSVSSTP